MKVQQCLVEVANLSVLFSGQPALNGVSLILKNGENTFLVGSNGSGKSTLLRVIAGVVRPSRGTVTRHSSAIGYVGHLSQLYQDLTVLENLNFFAALGRVKQARVSELIGKLNLKRFLSASVSVLSQGTRQRVALARAMLPRPDLLLLDEPTASLDEQSLESFKELLSSWSAEEGVTFVMATHDLARLGDLPGASIHLEHGRIETGPMSM